MFYVDQQLLSNVETLPTGGDVGFQLPVKYLLIGCQPKMSSNEKACDTIFLTTGMAHAFVRKLLSLYVELL